MQGANHLGPVEFWPYPKLFIIRDNDIAEIIFELFNQDELWKS